VLPNGEATPMPVTTTRRCWSVFMVWSQASQLLLYRYGVLRFCRVCRLCRLCRVCRLLENAPTYKDYKTQNRREGRFGVDFHHNGTKSFDVQAREAEGCRAVVVWSYN
jgi:hypothetical protein